MNTISSYEAKRKLFELLDRVADGERITITRYGVPVAILVPAPTKQRCAADDVIAEIKQFRQEHSLNGLSLRDMIDQGRR